MKKILALTLSLTLLLSTITACNTGTEGEPSSPSEGEGNTVIGATFEDNIEWDAEYDVVVVGYGGAGAVASITAADGGANVLMIEKAPKGEEGGNTRYAAQIILAPTDREKAITYFKAMRGGYDNQTDVIIETIVDGSMQNIEWLESMGAEDIKSYPILEFPELPGIDGIDSVIIGESWTSSFYKLLQKNVESRAENIDVWFSAPGKELIFDPLTGVVHGIRVEADGKLINVRAINGVVLACGGFENNEEMVENYTQMPYAFSKGAKYNEGDGIKMAMRVGADLWHMSALSGPDVNFKDPDLPTASFGYAIQNKTMAGKNIFMGVTSRNVIFVGSDGTRFIDEATFPRHGHVNNSGTWISMQIPTPSYMIFDETARLGGRLYPSWSEDSSAEIEKGYITKADTLEELAEKIGVPVEGLMAEIAEYNGFCAAGRDIVFDRDPETLKPIATGPFYALELSPTFTNTQGGPKRNENAEILDVDGKPIPHLYSAGELGSYYADIYNGGGNLSECIFSGRTAATNAIASKADVSAESKLGGKTPFVPTTAASNLVVDVKLAENERLGTGKGMAGDIVVKVTLDGDKITAVEIISQNETLGVSDQALVDIPAAIVAANSPEVDEIAGATLTSKGIMEAVKDALDDEEE